MKKKLLSVLLCLTMCTVVFAGCQKTQNDESGNAVEDASAEPAAQESADALGNVEKLEAATLNVYIAASLADAMDEVAALYNETQPDVTIVYNADSSGTLQTQIEEAGGADVDLFFSAAVKQMDALVEEGYVDQSTVCNLLNNEVCLIAAKDSQMAVTGFDNMTEAANIALADDTVPVGQYTREIFDSLGISEADFAEINSCDNVSAVKEAVKEGSNEIGTVYYSDYYSVKDDVDLIEIADQSLYSPCIYPVGQVVNPNADEAQLAAAKDFLAFLQTDEAKAVFEKYMFSIYEE